MSRIVGGVVMWLLCIIGGIVEFGGLMTLLPAVGIKLGDSALFSLARIRM